MRHQPERPGTNKASSVNSNGHSVVLIAYYYLWDSSVGSRRARALAQELADRGWQVTVVASKPPGAIPRPDHADEQAIEVLTVPHVDRVLIAKALLARCRRGQLRQSPEPTGTPLPSASPQRTELGSLRTKLASIVSFPDSMWEWSWIAAIVTKRAGVRADLVLATAPPMAALAAGRILAKRVRCPLVIDMRDLWTGDPYRRVPRPLAGIDRWLERRILHSATRLTTVAEPLAEELRAICHSIPVAVIPNGLNLSWMRTDESKAEPARIVFTGSLSGADGRSLDTLLDAVATLGSDRTTVPFQVDFYGPVSVNARQAIERSAAAKLVVLHGRVSAERSREAQHTATVLVNIPWEDPREFGKLPAKLFEYAAAGRPVLHIGQFDNLGKRFLESLGIGYFASPSESESIAGALRLLLSNPRFERASSAQLEPFTHRVMVDRFEAELLQALRDGPRASSPAQ